MSNETPGPNRVLLAEVAPWGISYVIADSYKAVHSLHVFHFPADISADKAAVLIKQSAASVPELQEAFSRVTIVYQYPEAVLVPQTYLQQQYTRELLELSAGNISDATIVKDYVQQEQLYVVFAIPRIQESVINYLFQADRVTHAYVQLLQTQHSHPGHWMQCIFGNNAFVLHLVKDGKLCLLQHYHFKAPEDVAYLLLKACEVHDIDARELHIHVAGMITANSAVFACMMKYFLQVEFSALPDGLNYPAGTDQYPAHYFSHLFQLLLCEL